jgi:Ca-activated chloride channel family protein
VSFLEPLHLLAGLGVLALAIGYVVMALRAKRYAVRFTNLDLLDTVAPRRPGWRRHLPAIALVAAASALVIAFARPTREGEVPRERATVIMAIDTSLSMQATDVDPSRIDAAKEAAVTFLDRVPASINVGLVSFNGIATVRVPPTTDRRQVEQAIRDLDLGESTAIGEAIFASLDAIDAVAPDPDGTTAPARIVLMSDGETTVGRPDESATAAARTAGVAVSTIAFGTAQGIITLPDDPRPIPVPVNPAALRDIAATTDGSFFEAPTAERLEAVYTDIGSSIGYETVEVEISSWFVGAALGLLALSAAMALWWSSRFP